MCKINPLSSKIAFLMVNNLTGKQIIDYNTVLYISLINVFFKSSLIFDFYVILYTEKYHDLQNLVIIYCFKYIISFYFSYCQLS